MSDDRKPERTLDVIEDQSLEDELGDVAAMSDEELAAEMREAGVDPASVRAEGLELAERAARPAAGRAGAPARTPPRFVWLAAAAVLLALGGLAATRREAIATWLRGSKPEPILPDNERAPEPTPQEIAEKLRDEAEAACAQGLYGRCASKLDEAKKLDPAGEEGARTKALRTTLVKNTTLPKDWNPKGTPGR